MNYGHLNAEDKDVLEMSDLKQENVCRKSPLVEIYCK
jgi:hypothetical protein